VQAWERTTGSTDVKVAVLDGGINFDQPDLAPNVWNNPGESGSGRESNGVDDDGNGYVDDWRGWDFVQQDNDPSDNFGHGTHVAGTIAARGDNALGVSGVAWHASLIPVRVLDNTNVGTCTDIAAGLEYAVRAGARIVNMSLGSFLPCQAERDVIDSAPDTLFVAAAMNQGIDVDATPVYPCAYPSPNIICVAATDSRDTLAGFSDYGARSVDLGAPGVSVLSSYVKWDPKVSLFTDGFETPLAGRWVTGGTPDSWVRTPFVSVRSGSPDELDSATSSPEVRMRLSRTTRTRIVAAAAGLIALAVLVSAASAAGFTLRLTASSTPVVGTPMLLHATGTVSPQDLEFPYWFSLDAIPASVTSTCPPDAFEGSQIAVGSGGSIIVMTQREIPDADGNFSIPVAVTPSAPGSVLLCAYTDDGAAATLAAASLFHALCEGLARLELRGNFPVEIAEQHWRQGMEALVHGLTGQASDRRH
jgi:subtilisin family serine protease